MKQQRQSQPNSRLFYQEWGVLLLIVGVAAAMRFWRIGDLPPGLYRDEAFNGLDALKVLQGEHALYFADNNGREPLYIYLVALSVQIFGRTALAVRLPAAIFGTLTTIPTYLFAKTWFGKQTGALTALIWAITLWPIHLSRLGFRTALLPFFAALFLYSVSRAYQHKFDRFALAVAGFCYALMFYTYLAARLTPGFLILFSAYLIWRGEWGWVRRAIPWFGLGMLLGILPLGLYTIFNWEVVFGRTGQVSILSPAINQGDLLGTFWRHLVNTLGMFFWRGDTIVRHNPAARPVFDWLMTLPFLIGVGWCAYHWRKPAAFVPLSWVAVMLWGTILAEDAPHFLRAVGVLPVLLIFPAIGLSRLWNWSKLSRSLSGSIIALLLLGSSSLTMRDYFVGYAQADETAYLFEDAARTLAEQVNQDRSHGLNSIIDKQFASEWASIPFLIEPEMQTFDPQRGFEGNLTTATSIYVWPYESTNFLEPAFAPPVLVDVTLGDMARADLALTPYSLYTRYAVFPEYESAPPLANFDNQLFLHEIVHDSVATTQQVDIQLTWSQSSNIARELKAFVHLIDRESGEIIGQTDAPIGGSLWLQEWWEVDVNVREIRTILLPKVYRMDEITLLVGVYDAVSLERLSLLDDSGKPVGDSWEFQED